MELAKYEGDIIAWANQQAEFIRNKQFDLLDLENIAEEILEVGKSESRELESRLAVLIEHLLKWKYQPERRGNSWKRTIKTQRNCIIRAIQKTPSLKPNFSDDFWQESVYDAAVRLFARETNLDENSLPEVCEWNIYEQILNEDFLPN